MFGLNPSTGDVSCSYGYHSRLGLCNSLRRPTRTEGEIKFDTLASTDEVLLNASRATRVENGAHVHLLSIGTGVAG